MPPTFEEMEAAASKPLPSYEEKEAATKSKPSPPPSSPIDSDNPECLTEAEIGDLADSLEITDPTCDVRRPTSRPQSPGSSHRSRLICAYNFICME